MIKSGFKIALFVFVVLAVGQISAGKNTVGGHFVAGVKTGCVWSGEKLLETKWFSGITLPPFITEWFSQPVSRKDVPKKTNEKRQGSFLGDEVSKTDREAMLKLLQ